MPVIAIPYAIPIVKQVIIEAIRRLIVPTLYILIQLIKEQAKINGYYDNNILNEGDDGDETPDNVVPFPGTSSGTTTNPPPEEEPPDEDDDIKEDYDIIYDLIIEPELEMDPDYRNADNNRRGFTKLQWKTKFNALLKDKDSAKILKDNLKKMKDKHFDLSKQQEDLIKLYNEYLDLKRITALPGNEKHLEEIIGKKGNCRRTV